MKLPPGVKDVSHQFASICLSIAQTMDESSDAADTKQLVEPRIRAVLADAPQITSTSNAAVKVALINPGSTAPTLLIPGLFGDSARFMAAPFATSRSSMAAEGYRTNVAWVNGRAGCDANATVLRSLVLDAAQAAGEPVHLIAYSKGCADALHLMANFPDSHASIRSLTSLAGIVQGTPLANDTRFWLDALVRWIPVPGAGIGDGHALDDLDPDFRCAHLEKHPLPVDIRFASMVASPSLHAVSRVLRRSWRKLARANSGNDSQVIENDAILPHGDFLGRVAVDHWAIALPIVERHPWLSWFVNHNHCPRGVLLRALIQHMSLPDLPTARR